MPILKTIEDFGYQRSFFKISSGDPISSFQYYMFDTQWSPYADEWNLLGLQVQHTPFWSLDVQLLYINEEALLWEHFEALRDAEGFLNLRATEMSELVRVFEVLDEAKSQDEEMIPPYFHPLNADELSDIHLSHWEITHNGGRSYRYIPDKQVANEANVSIVRFPLWRHDEDERQSAMLSFATFPQILLEDPRFHPFETGWYGTMTFTQQAWHAFVMLLKHYAYENDDSV